MENTIAPPNGTCNLKHIAPRYSHPSSVSSSPGLLGCRVIFVSQHLDAQAVLAVPPAHHNRVCSLRALHFLVPSSQIIRVASMPTQSGSYICTSADTYVTFLREVLVPPDERPATTRHPLTNFVCSWRPLSPPRHPLKSTLSGHFGLFNFQSPFNTFTLIVVIASFTHRALAYPVLCLVGNVSCTAWSAHIAYV